MKITYKVALWNAVHEAIVRQAYKDPVGVWTWSIGLTSMSGHNVTRYIGKPQTLRRCLEVYVWALGNYAKDVEDAFAGYELKENELAAALSFHYNTGAIKRAGWVKLVKEGKRSAAKHRLMTTYVTGGGKYLKGLADRREREAELFFNGKWGDETKITEYTRLTSRSTPMWSSGVKIDIEQPLKEAMKIDGPPSDEDDNTDEMKQAALWDILKELFRAIWEWYKS